jgi:hypothetical protein
LSLESFLKKLLICVINVFWLVVIIEDGIIVLLQRAWDFSFESVCEHGPKIEVGKFIMEVHST